MLPIPPPKDERWPLLQASPALLSGSGSPPEPVGVSRAPLARVRQEERGVPEQSQTPTAQQLLEQRAFVVTLRLQRQRSQQDQVPPRQAEQLQVRPAHTRVPQLPADVELMFSAVIGVCVPQREGQPEPLGHRQPSSPPLPQLLTHPQETERFTQLHGGSQDHQVTTVVLCEQLYDGGNSISLF